jgi:hypothetical protein
MNLLEKALNKVSRKTLDQIDRGELIVLNERYVLYSYFTIDYFVIIDTDESVDDEIFCVQYADYYDQNNKELVYTDLYGYDEIEQSLNNKNEKSKMSRFEIKETLEEKISRLQGYYDDPNNGLNKCFLSQTINNLKQQ